MKAWVKPGLETLDVSMTMNDPILNSAIVTANDVDNNPVETPSSDGAYVGLTGTNNSDAVSTDSSSEQSETSNKSGSNEASEETGDPSILEDQENTSDNSEKQDEEDTFGEPVDASEDPIDLDTNETDKEDHETEQSPSPEEANCSTPITDGTITIDETINLSETNTLFPVEGQILSESIVIGEELQFGGSCSGDQMLDSESRLFLARFAYES